MPRLLFVAPTYPDTQGNGLAMRAGVFLEALSRVYRVTLLVVPVFGEQSETSRELTGRCCERVVDVELRSGRGPLDVVAGRFDGRPELMRLFAQHGRAAARALASGSFDVIHAFRFYTAPLAVALSRSRAGANAALHLDLDDIESETRRKLAGLYRLNGREDDAEAEDFEAQRYETAEHQLLPSFHRVYVCSEEDGERVRPYMRGDLRVAPNAVRPPAFPVEPRTTHPFTLLFVGTLSYYPNEDAVAWFCRDVLPKVRSVAESPFRVRVAGRGAPAGLRPLARLPEVRLVGAVADVAAEYADADAVIVPVRAGGGTRIKVLEAFAYGRPVITTSAGLEGIAARPEEHCLIADTPGEFATQCLRLMRNPDLGREVAERAFALVTTRYSPEVVARAVTATG